MSAPYRAPARRPRVVMFNVFETMLKLRPLRKRFVDIGRHEHELNLFLTRALLNGSVIIGSGVRPTFTEIARSALLTITAYQVSEEAVQHVLDGFHELPPHPDVEPALVALARARIPAYAFTQWSAVAASSSLDRVGLRTYLRDVMSFEEIRSTAYSTQVHPWACAQVGCPPERAAMVAVQSWEIHTAARAGLVTGFATRLERALPDIVDRPHVMAERIDEVVDQLLALPE